MLDFLQLTEITLSNPVTDGFEHILQSLPLFVLDRTPIGKYQFDRLPTLAVRNQDNFVVIMTFLYFALKKSSLYIILETGY